MYTIEVNDLSSYKLIEVQDLSKVEQKIVEANVSPVQAVNGLVGFVNVNPSIIGLGNVNNTADIDKPVSIPVANALAALEQSILSQVQLSSSADLEFQVALLAGVDAANILFPRSLSQKPKSVTCSIENNIDDLIYNHQISNVTKLGFDIEFSDYLSSNGYILHVVASL
jgi:hypothetical protein